MRYIVLTFVVLLVILVIFIPWTMMSGLRDSLLVEPGNAGGEEQTEREPDHYPFNPEVAVFMNRTEEVSRIPLEEYVVGVVAAEMPASFHKEALKAQAILARTYAVAKLRHFGGEGTVLAENADISDNPDYDQAWMSDEHMRDRWGFLGYWINRRRIAEAVQATAGLVVIYDGRLIQAVYHSTSGGRTENAEAVWGNPYPYLMGVASPHEDHSPYDLTRHEFSWETLSERLGLSRAMVLAAAGDPRSPVVEVQQHTETGRVAEASVVGHTFTGVELRQILNLPSTWWEVEEKQESIVFLVRGFGHGVGLSQYGADGMAEQGHSYREIISHYYPGTSLHSLDEVMVID